jgi:hypothetical protein
MREADYTRMQVALDETLERLVAVSPLTPPTPNTHTAHYDGHFYSLRCCCMTRSRRRSAKTLTASASALQT